MSRAVLNLAKAGLGELQGENQSWWAKVHHFSGTLPHCSAGNVAWM